VINTTRGGAKLRENEDLSAWISAAEISEQIGATEYRVNRAILALGMYESGRKPINDGRRRVYPPETKEKVAAWLAKN